MTESLDESHKLHKGLIFWVCNFHEFIFLGLIFPGIYFLGIQKMPGPSPPVMYMSEYTPWGKDRR